MKSILIINHGFLGDGMLASSFAENCKRNGFDRVDMLVGFPQLLTLLSGNPHIDNVYILEVGSHPNITKELLEFDYDVIYTTEHLVFNERPVDTFNKKVGLTSLDYNLKLYVPQAIMDTDNKPKLAFQLDWADRSTGPDRKPRDINNIIQQLSQKYSVHLVGGDTHYNISKDTPLNFLKHCALIQACDLFFGYPGGMHWVACGVGTPTICTSEHVVNHYIGNGEFKGSNFQDFCDEWMVHASKQSTQKHILFEPYVSDDFIVNYLLNINYEDLL